MFGDKPRELPQPVALILVPEFTMMAVTSVIEPLRLANRQAERPLYKWSVHSTDAQPIAASNGMLTFAFSPDGTAISTRVATAALPVSPGERIAVRGTLDTNDGGDHTVRFFTAANIDSPWTQLGAAVTQSGTVTVHQSTTPLEVGSRDDGTLGLLPPGTVFAVEVHLVESDTRKAAFLREAARVTGAPVQVHAERIEDVAGRLAGTIDIVTARALAPLPKLLAWAAPLFEAGTRGLLLKGQDVDKELTDSAKSWKIQSKVLPSRTDPRGRIVVIDRVVPKR
jgi:hypothetical protein